MNFTVGLSQIKYDFTDCIIKNKNRIDEVYFSYPGIQNGRMTQEALSDKPLFEQLNFVHESEGNTIIREHFLAKDWNKSSSFSVSNIVVAHIKAASILNIDGNIRKDFRKFRHNIKN